tara:strand:- start:2259 stop:2483 length:225 start_codon:yes stop_codon:yes gene_type:complete
MSDSSVINKMKVLRVDLDNESNLLRDQMELPLNEIIIKNRQSENNSVKLSRGVAFSRWVRRMTSQFDSVDPFYK